VLERHRIEFTLARYLISDHAVTEARARGWEEWYVVCHCQKESTSGPGRWRFCAVGRELQNSLNLFSRHAKFFHKIVNAHVLKIFKHH
jgi:hypothetical protein